MFSLRISQMILCHGNFLQPQNQDPKLHILGGSTPLATGYCQGVFFHQPEKAWRY